MGFNENISHITKPGRCDLNVPPVDRKPPEYLDWSRLYEISNVINNLESGQLVVPNQFPQYTNLPTSTVVGNYEDPNGNPLPLPPERLRLAEPLAPTTGFSADAMDID